MPRSVGAQPGNRNALIHGLYAERFSKRELELIGEFAAAEDGSLTDEIVVLRFLLHRAVGLLVKRRGFDDQMAGLDLVGDAASKLAQLLRVQRVLRGEGADSLAGALAVALHEISEELGLDSG